MFAGVIFFSGCGKVTNLSEQAGITFGAAKPLVLPAQELLPVSLEIPYKEIIAVDGGQAPFTFRVTHGELLEGLNLDAATGVISGQISKAMIAKQMNFSLEVNDSSGLKAEQSYKIHAADYSFSIAPKSLPTITPGISFAMKLSVQGAVEPVKFSVSGALPQKLTLGGDGALMTTGSGVEAANEKSEWPIEVTATDANKVSATAKYTVKIGEAPTSSTLTIHTTALSSMQVGGYSSGISTTGGVAPLSYAIDSGSLPAGLTLDATTGLISGTIPSSAANTAFAIVVKVSDATGQTASKTYTGTVAPGSSLLTIHTTTLSQITSGIAFSYALAVTGGSMPRTYSVSSGGLPTGLALNSSSGLISGTPTAGTAGQAYAFTITCTDADSQNASKTYTGTVASSSTSSLGIVTTTIPAPSAGSSYLAAIGVTGGTAPYTYAVSAGALPSGLSINSSSGLISGSVAHAAKGSSYLFTITVTDAASLSASQIYSGFVGAYTTAVVPAALVAATPGASYSASLASVGGEAPYTYTITSGALPSGLSLNSGMGLISGVVSEAEAGNTKNFTIRSVDANNVQVSVNYALTINAFAVVVSTATLQDAIESAMYSNGGVAVAASGGTGPYSFEYSGALPGGIGLSSSGSFFGVPDLASGSLPSGTIYTIHVRARDSLNQVSAQKTLTLKVTINAPVVSAGTPANAVLGSSYHHSFAATGGRAPYVFAVAAGSLPSGLSLSTNGAVSGAATATSTCPASQFSISATDSLGQTSALATKCIATVTGVSISNATFPTIVTGVSYNASTNVIGGSSPYIYSATGLPSGVSLNSSTGVLSGYVNDPVGDYVTYITVTDSSSPALAVTRTFTFKVRDPLVVTTSTLAKAGTGVAYGPVNLTTSGGEAPYNFSISAGSLPSGLSLSTSGAITGTPAYNTAVGTGTFNFSVVATDASGLTSVAKALTLNVSVAPKIDMPFLSPAVVGTPYATDIKRIGGVNPIISAANLASQLTWSATGLPPGLSMNTGSGRISGTPSSAAGSPYTVQVSVTDANGIQTSKNLQMVVSNSGKTLDLTAARAVEPCPQSPTYNCYPRGFAIAKLVTAQATTNYIVYSANISPGTVASPVPRIYIARLDSTGRFPTPGTSVLSVAYTPSPVGYITSLDLADVDNDGNTDIVFADHTNNKIVVVWNSGTVDGNGMPVFSAQNNFSMPAGGAASNRPYIVKAVQLRPDPTNSNKKDLIVSDWNFSPAGTVKSRIVTFLAQNSCSANCSGSRSTVYTGVGASITAYSTDLSGGQAILQMPSIAIGYFDTAPGAGVCPSIAVVGKQDNNNNDWVYIRNQTFGGGVCDGNFSVHGANDEKLIGSGNTAPGGLSVADLTNDGISDIAVTLRTAQTSSASVKVFIMPGGGLFPASALTPLLPSTTGVNYGAGKIIPYCLNGAASCSYPSLLVVGNRDASMGATGNNGFISLLPNSGGAPYFEDGTGNNRIDYIAPNGIGSSDPIASPIVSSGLNDIVFMGAEANGYPYYFLLTRNGASTSWPFRQMQPLRSYPDLFSAAAEVGAVRLADANNDGTPDIFGNLVNQSAVTLLVGQSATNETADLPQSTYNGMGVSHNYPNTWHYQNTMDVADFNNDGYPDVAVTGYNSRAIAVSLGDGTNYLESARLLEVGTSGDIRPTALTINDFDQDGNMDVVTVNLNTTTGTTSLAYLRGKGNGEFFPAVEFFTASALGCNDARALASQDLNGDGRPELLALCYANQALWVIRRHADGTWVRNSGLTVNTSGGINGTFLRVGRLTSTTGTDVVVGGLDYANSMRIINGLTLSAPDVTGNFTVSSSLSPYIALRGYGADAEIADLNADGYGDIVISMQTQNSTNVGAGQLLYTCRSTGLGACTVEGWGLELPNATGLAVGDLNNDGLYDIIQGAKVGQRLFYRMISRYLNVSQ